MHSIEKLITDIASGNNGPPLEITHINIVGMSSGGYAAIQLARMLSSNIKNKHKSLITFAINPQTGFSNKLTQKINSAIEKHPNAEILPFGQDPIYLESMQLPDSHLEVNSNIYRGINLDIKDAFDKFDEVKVIEPIIYYHFDMLNTIEHIYASELKDVKCIKLKPAKLGLRHSIGVHAMGLNFLKLDLLHTWARVPFLKNELQGESIKVIDIFR